MDGAPPAPMLELVEAGSAVRRDNRLRDAGLAAMLTLLAAPAMLLIALAIKLDTAGPVFFRQRRLGRDRREFTVLKFRTMAADASPALHREYIAHLVQRDPRTAPAGLQKLTDDPRVTRAGRRIRRLSLDELPQLLNVIAGHMALVGPRPALHYELEFYEDRHYARFSVLPGLTGLWQVSARSRVGFLEMLDLDVEYVRRRSRLLDLQILLKTPLAMFRHSA